MIRIRVDLTNPGQFFGCCGLFELAHRLWPNTTAHFESSEFVVSAGRVQDLVDAVTRTTLKSLDASDASASPIELGAPWGLRLDWWKDREGGGAGLKPWAGTMLALRIAQAMQAALPRAFENAQPFDSGFVVLGPDGKKVEPYYFDARRGASALPLDMGFSSDKLGLEAVAFPASEFLTLVGLQRFRPAIVRPRVYQYRAWGAPLPIALASLASALVLPQPGWAFQFENAFRTDQRKHKAFTPAVPVKGENNE